MLYRKRPVIIEAFRLPLPADAMDLTAFSLWKNRVGFPTNARAGDEGGSLVIPTLEGDMLARAGDWIIKGVKGEFYPCRHDIFEATYERVPEDRL
jgi:hypothetical protein